MPNAYGGVVNFSVHPEEKSFAELVFKNHYAKLLTVVAAAIATNDIDLLKEEIVRINGLRTASRKRGNTEYPIYLDMFIKDGAGWIEFADERILSSDESMNVIIDMELKAMQQEFEKYFVIYNLDYGTRVHIKQLTTVTSQFEK